MSKHISGLMVVSAIIGAVAGLLVPKAEAGVGLSIRFTPPALETKGARAALTTEWHSTNGSPIALDWGRFLEDQVTEDWGAYLRGFGYQGGISTSSAAAIYQDDTLQCYRLRADFYDEVSGRYGATIFFTHTQSNGTTSVAFTHTSGGYYNSEQVGLMASPDKAGCTTTGPHIHQYEGTTSLYGETGQGSYYRNSAQFTTTGRYLNDDPVTYWTHRFSW